MSNIKTKDLKSYATYLRDYYISNTSGKKAALYFQLTEFIEHNKIKGILFNNTRQEEKLQALEWYKRKIEEFSEFHDSNIVTLKLFDEHLNELNKLP